MLVLTVKIEAEGEGAGSYCAQGSLEVSAFDFSELALAAAMAFRTAWLHAQAFEQRLHRSAVLERNP